MSFVAVVTGGVVLDLALASSCKIYIKITIIIIITGQEKPRHNLDKRNIYSYCIHLYCMGAPLWITYVTKVMLTKCYISGFYGSGGTITQSRQGSLPNLSQQHLGQGQNFTLSWFWFSCFYFPFYIERVFPQVPCVTLLPVLVVFCVTCVNQLINSLVFGPCVFPLAFVRSSVLCLFCLLPVILFLLLLYPGSEFFIVGLLLMGLFVFIGLSLFFYLLSVIKVNFCSVYLPVLI